jgi:alkylation response protein AidB-like acyl-CoA dehydrogenase
MGTSMVRVTLVILLMAATHIQVDYPMGRILRDSRLYAVGAGTQEIRRMLIGREFNEQFKSS